MERPDNYYAILGVPLDADNATLKRAYRQLARRYHPDLAGPEGAVHMKRINRAYDVLSSSQKRLQYDTIISGSIDLRQSGPVRPRPLERRFSPEDEAEFAGLSIFSTRGPLHTGARLHSALGVISALGSVQTPSGLLLAAGSLDGKGICWYEHSDQSPVNFAMDPGHRLESLRELRFSAGGTFIADWGRLGLHVWHTIDGSLQWSYPLEQRAVSAHYSLDMVLQELQDGATLWMALPLQLKDPLAPRIHAVRGSQVVAHTLGRPSAEVGEPLTCQESELEKRQFWAIRLRALTPDRQTLCTLSCASVPDEAEQMIVLRRWDLTGKARFRNRPRPQISTAITAGLCARCTPPYALTADARMLAFVYEDCAIRLHDTLQATYSELASGPMGASSRLAISSDGEWVAVAREDSEVNEGVVDLWSATRGQVLQKLYHPWQVSALHFAEKRLFVALTDGTIQTWK
jgi:WD40 repeat protein